jgi:hypothetical protein
VRKGCYLVKMWGRAAIWSGWWGGMLPGQAGWERAATWSGWRGKAPSRPRQWGRVASWSMWQGISIITEQAAKCRYLARWWRRAGTWLQWWGSAAILPREERLLFCQGRKGCCLAKGGRAAILPRKEGLLSGRGSGSTYCEHPARWPALNKLLPTNTESRPPILSSQLKLELPSPSSLLTVQFHPEDTSVPVFSCSYFFKDSNRSHSLFSAVQCDNCQDSYLLR